MMQFRNPFGNPFRNANLAAMRVIAAVFVLLLITACKKEQVKTDRGMLLHAVRGSNPGIYDGDGRYMLLRGVNYNVLGDYWQANPSVPSSKRYDAEDIRLMAQYGINCIRLIFHWSALEPQRGTYNRDYIRRIEQVVREAAKYKMYVLLDMHQDAWGKYIASKAGDSCMRPNKGWDGAPEWATITDGASTCVTGGRETAPAVIHAFQNFWDNTNGINDACIAAWKGVVQSLAAYPNVVGYDLINEPNLGYKPLNENVRKLSTYYGKLIRGIRDAEATAGTDAHIVFFEMSVTANGEGIPFIPFPDFSADKNMIFAPHLYFEAISYQLTIEQGFDVVNAVSKLFNTSMFIGEWGFFDMPSADIVKLKRFAAKEDEYITGSAWWQWCQAPGDPHGISWDGMQYGNTSMALIELDRNANFTGNVNTLFLNVLSRSRPVAIFGKPEKLVSNPDHGTMHLEAKSNAAGITALWIPDRFGEPVLSGANLQSYEIKKVNGGYSVDAHVNGHYTIDVRF
jgi:endoglycosylceramidase